MLARSGERIATADHPHAGGENLPARRRIHEAMRGPSPRGWGEPARISGRERHGTRTIPTRVGRTYLQPSASPSASPGGPSPRGWGEPQRWCPETRDSRTIPTRVGRTAAPLSGLGSACGGPSPRGWGEPRADVDSTGNSRTIPTRVGRTYHAMCKMRYIDADHPHAGGENVIQPDSDEATARTIPTRVGRTRPDDVSTSGGFADHPHAGGENFQLPPIDDPRRDRPRARWAKPVARHLGFESVLLPDHPRAGWGKLTSAGCACKRSDHPHAGGENHLSRHGSGQTFRTIPARVGKTSWPWRRPCSRSGPSPRGRGKL